MEIQVNLVSSLNAEECWGHYMVLGYTKLANPTLQVQVRVEAGSGLQNLAFTYLLVLKAE